MSNSEMPIVTCLGTITNAKIARKANGLTTFSFRAGTPTACPVVITFPSGLKVLLGKNGSQVAGGGVQINFDIRFQAVEELVLP